MKISIFRCTLATTLFVASTMSMAQKLPNLQVTSVRPTKKIKIDGSITEWEPLQAYNRAAMVEYTIANDSTNLFLILKSANRDITSKILVGGISLRIYTDNKKQNVSITFPYVRSKTTFSKEDSKNLSLIKIGDSLTIQDIKRNDSLYHLVRDNKLKQFTEMKLSGISSIPDTIISIYNLYGFKAKLLVDVNNIGYYELAVPLKYLPVSALKEFKYNVILNGGGSRFSAPANVSGKPIFGPGGVDQRSLAAPTYFSGEYTLAY